MDIKQIRSLAKIMEDSGLSVLEFTEGETGIYLERPSGAPAPLVVPAAASPQAAWLPADAVSAQAPVKDLGNTTEVKSPMVGVFYEAPSPDSDPYVTVGTKVKKGDVLCIIEAMKLMNEITAQVDGEVADICVQNGQVVEFNQPLFKIK